LFLWVAFKWEVLEKTQVSAPSKIKSVSLTRDLLNVFFRPFEVGTSPG
jgi:hypothetical protein